MNITKFNEYYEYYLTLHTKSLTKIFHLIGVLFTILYIVWCILHFHIFLLMLAPFVVYPFAWFSHRFIEKNVPASFSNPFYAKLADLRMCYEIITGKFEL